MESNSQVMKAVFVASRPTSSMMMMTRENVAYDKGLTEMSLWDAICVSVFYSTETCVRLYHCDH